MTASGRSGLPGFDATREANARAKRKKRRRNALPDVESVIDQFMAMERIVASRSYPGTLPRVDDLRVQADLVMDIAERSLLIEDEARERTASRRLGIAERLLPIVLKALAALVGVALIVAWLLTMDRAEYDELLHSILSLGPTPYSAIAALGAGMFTLNKLRKRDSGETARADEDNDPQAPGLA